MPRDSASALDISDLIAAYTIGYFPMARARDAQDVIWVLPDDRGVLPLDQARAPKKLLRLMRRAPFEIRIDTAFADVVAACAAPGPNRDDTWINDQIYEAYCELHYLGLAHSVECWRDDVLVGGLYGVAIGGVFCGESMFSLAPNASKIAMLHLIARLRLGGFGALDTQFYTEHLSQFGVIEEPNRSYQERLAALLPAPAAFLRAPTDPARQSSLTASVWQSITQTS